MAQPKAARPAQNRVGLPPAGVGARAELLGVPVPVRVPVGVTVSEGVGVRD